MAGLPEMSKNPHIPAAGKLLSEFSGRDSDSALFVTTILHQFAESLGNAIDAKDAHTSAHSDEVAQISHTLALTMGLSPQEADIIHVAGHLHDIGKIGVPDAVLSKQGSLDHKEWLAIRKHPEAGRLFCVRFHPFSGSVSSIWCSITTSGMTAKDILPVSRVPRFRLVPVSSHWRTVCQPCFRTAPIVAPGHSKVPSGKFVTARELSLTRVSSMHFVSARTWCRGYCRLWQRTRQRRKGGDIQKICPYASLWRESRIFCTDALFCGRKQESKVAS